MRVFMTGATGFIGARLATALLEDGHEVIGLARSDRSAKALREAGIEVARGDLCDPDALRAALHQCQPTHVAHLAAEIATQRDPARIQAVNVRGTEALIEGAREVPLEGFLFLSTVVRGEANGAMLTEDTAIEAKTVYGRSKAEGDRLVLQAHEDGVPSTVLRPSHVYGPGGWFEELITDPWFRVPGSGQNLWDVVHVDDVVSACVLLLERGGEGEVFHVVDDEPLTMRAFFDEAARALGRRPWGWAPQWLGRLLKGADPITSAVRSARSSNRKLKSIGWVPHYPRAHEGLAATAEALRTR